MNTGRVSSQMEVNDAPNDLVATTIEVSDLIDPSTHLDLASLLALGGTSPVLQGCIGDDTYSMRSLRLVSKSISPLALLALRKYTLTLKGDDKDTNVSGASLLQQAKLSDLIVHLRLTGKCRQGLNQ